MTPQSQLTSADLRLARAARRSRALWDASTAATHPAIDLFGVRISNLPLDRATANLLDAARQRRRTRAVFVNAHVVNEMAVRQEYAATVAEADTILADGSGLAIAARLAGTPLADNVNGTDLFPLLAAMANEAGEKIFLLGGAPGVAEAAAAKLTQFGLGSAIAGTHHGHFKRHDDDEQSVIDAVNASGASIVLVGLGVPLQDTWIATNHNRLITPVAIGVGGLFDYFAGRVSRAPFWLRSIGLEWMWRLMLEPRRLAKRYLVGNAVFLIHAVREAARVRRHRNATPRPSEA